MRFLLILLLCLTCEACQSSPSVEKDDGGRTLTVLTYNVLASEHRDELRIPALFDAIEATNADIVCLQEVLPDFLDRLKAQQWFRARYRVPQYRGRDAVANGNCIFARFPAEDVRAFAHASRQGRESLIVTLNVDGEPIRVATCHLESPLEAGELRREQLSDVFRLLAEDSHVIFAGDFNFGDGEQPETSALPAEYVDLWAALRPEDPGFTWNIERNAMAKRGSFVGEPSRRIDRILLRSAHWRPESVRLLGDRPIGATGDLFPSDHFGVIAVLLRADVGR